MSFLNPIVSRGQAMINSVTNEMFQVRLIHFFLQTQTIVSFGQNNSKSCIYNSQVLDVFFAVFLIGFLSFSRGQQSRLAWLIKLINGTLVMPRYILLFFYLFLKTLQLPTSPVDIIGSIILRRVVCTMHKCIILFDYVLTLIFFQRVPNPSANLGSFYGDSLPEVLSTASYPDTNCV